MKITKSKLRNKILNNEDISDIDYSHITDMSWMFSGCIKLISLPKLNTKNVINMFCMFFDCYNLKSVPKIDTSNVTNMSYMFENCKNLKSVPKLDTSKVHNMYGMFDGCINLKKIDIENFPLYDFSELNNKYLKEKYPEYFI
jgi:surface protein